MTIVVALSGGVDSATCAGLLKEAGHRVIGISMRLYDARGTAASVGGRCCGPRDLEDARRVAAHLDIPFYVADYEDEFRARVIDDFVAEYAAGRTPNPCVRCNQHIKFTPLLRRARALGADALATGHYARLVNRSGTTLIARARDAHKDQSYFLFNMPKEDLGYVRFPLGELTKEEVRAHARRFGLPNADKRESQEICFVPDGDYAGFVASRTAPADGEIVDSETGARLGRHSGVHRFTIGQRRGIGGGLGAPRYVVGIDALTRRVTVGPQSALDRETIEIEDVSWAGGGVPAAPLSAAVQIRYRHLPRTARITPLESNRARVVFNEAERAPAPGQAAVFYDGDEVLGGGFIAAPRG